MCVRRDQNKKPVIVLGCFGSLDGGRDGGDVGTRKYFTQSLNRVYTKCNSRNLHLHRS
ncbi:Protein of unknown function [Pyronema omphalodes CBS 100304]|uniref:Uncharacterized protein n=1 Tax=Pyronema omphalodes (strain CBS 100304) TaxID=1076935 RepID=U4L0T1_PYROM|nr:Protein of unknown function [Pyronema omphalodes CBS 100304]